MLDDGLKLTIATSAEGSELDTLLQKAGVGDLIDHTTTSDDAKSSKPDPDIIQAALKKSGLKPDQVLMLGDTPFDIQSAEKAGVRSIALRTGGHDDDLQGAVAVYDTPEDFLAQYDDSPLGRLVRTGSPV
jgi:phosphoglycolate phosphatase-like HAD superfamily hydrolase